MVDHTTNPPHRRCGKCGVLKPHTAEYFVKDRRLPTGLTVRCIECDRKMGKERHTQQRDNPTVMDAERQRKAESRRRMAQDPAWVERSNKRDTQRRKKHRAENTPVAQKARAAQRKQRQRLSQNPEWAQRERDRRVREYALRKDDPEWRERRLETTRRHRQKPEIKALNTQRQAKYYRTPNGRASILTSNHRRAARKRSLPDTLTPRQWQTCLVYFNHSCAVCGRSVPTIRVIAQDHWVPLDKGGGTEAGNIVPLCHGDTGCNNSKHDDLPLDWLIRRYGKEQAHLILERINAYFVWALDHNRAE